MKTAALREALDLAEAREREVAMRDRLASGEALSLVIGAGSAASVIVLSPAYAERLRRDVIAGLDGRIAEADAALRERGVEP